MTNTKQIRSDVAGPLLFHGTRHVESSEDLSWDGSTLSIVGGLSVSNLSGSGTRMVVTDASGALSTQAIPSSATLTNTFIGVGNSSNILAGSARLSYNGTTFNVAKPVTDDSIVATIGGFTFTDNINGFTNRQSLVFGGFTMGNNADQPYISGAGLGLSSTTDMYIQSVGTTIFYTGNVQINDLAGSGTRMVVTDANGALSTQTITLGTLTSVSGTTNQINASTTGGAVTLSLPNSPHIAGTLFIGSTSGIQWGDTGIAGAINGFLAAAGDGIFRFGDSSGGGSPRIILGSISSTLGVAFQRNGATFEIRKGDNSGYADITALNARLTGLTGSGTRMVIADATGNLSTQALPTAPTLTQYHVGIGDASNLLGGSTQVTYDGIFKINPSGINFASNYLLGKLSIGATGDNIVGIQSTINTAISGILFGTDNTSLGVLAKYGSAAVGNFTGTSIPFAEATYLQSGIGFNLPIHLGGLVIYQQIGTSSSNYGTRLDDIGWRLGPANTLHTANTHKFSINGNFNFDGVDFGNIGLLSYGRMNGSSWGLQASNTDLGLYAHNSNSIITLGQTGNIDLFASTHIKSFTGALPTNYGTRLDNAGLRIGEVSTLGTSNTAIFEAGGVQFAGNGFMYSSGAQQSFLTLQNPTAQIGSFGTYSRYVQIEIDTLVNGIVQMNMSGITRQVAIPNYDLKVGAQSGTGNRLVEADSTGVQSATKEIVSAWVNDLTAITELEDPANWDILGNWIGSISNTYRGQEHYDANYFYKLVDADEPIRMIRG